MCVGATSRCGGLFIPGEHSAPVSLSESAVYTGSSHSADSYFSDHADSIHVATQEATNGQLMHTSSSVLHALRGATWRVGSVAKAF